MPESKRGLFWAGASGSAILTYSEQTRSAQAMRLCMTEHLGNDTTRMLPAQDQRQKPAGSRGEEWGTRRRRWRRAAASAVAKDRRGTVHSASANGWARVICRRQPNPRHGLGERSLECVAGPAQVRCRAVRCGAGLVGARVGCRTGTLLSRARRTQAWAGPSYHGVGDNYPKQDKTSASESRTVYASTFAVSAREEWR